jgi:hypothetical protein
MHNNTHCLLWNPAATFDKIITQEKLPHLCSWAEWANTVLAHNDIDVLLTDKRNHYNIANLVKLNMWVKSIREQGIVKPWLLLDQGDGTFLAGTGDSRLRCLERISEITTVPAFLSTTRDRRNLYLELEEVTAFDRFAELCGAVNDQEFLFRLTDPAAPYGLYWYEYDNKLTRTVTPGEAEALTMFTNYIKANPTTKFTPEWFDQKIDWQK